MQTIEKYRARKEAIPFGMSESIWELDKTTENFARYAEELQYQRRKYE